MPLALNDCREAVSEMDMSKQAKRDHRSPLLSKRTDFLYLFICGLEWHRHRHQKALWELLCARASPDPVVRCVAQALLAPGLIPEYLQNHEGVSFDVRPRDSKCRTD